MERMPESPKTPHALHEEFERLRKIFLGKDSSLKEVFNELEQKDHALLTLTLSVPFFLPVPVPGLSVLLGLIISFCGGAMMLGFEPWMPAFMAHRKIPAKTLEWIFVHASKVFEKIAPLLKPRGKLHQWAYFTHVNGLLIAIAGFLLALPLPPGTNLPPALCIALLSLATLQEDAVCAVLGYLLFLANIALFSTLAILGKDAVGWILGKLEHYTIF